MELHWTARVGERNAAWMSDPANFDGDTIGIDDGHGDVTITQQQMDVLCNLEYHGDGRPGDLEYDPEHGTLLNLPFTDGTDTATAFWLTERSGPPRSCTGC